MQNNFDYHQAFSRNIGWVTQKEQEILSAKRVAIAGLGGVGGNHLLTLIRLGIANFHIADFDKFDIVNFNRQVGANINTIGKSKVEVMTTLAQEINPEIKIKTFENGVDDSSIEEFLSGVDIYIDSLDFFAFDARKLLFSACYKKGIPAVTVAPLGMGAALINFLPNKMSFEEYFCLDECSTDEKAIRFLIGLAPALLQRAYLADPSTVNLSTGKGPSTFMACQLCAGIAATEALKILLNRGKVFSAPYGIQFDAYRNKLVHTWRPGGNKNLLQRLTIFIAKQQLAKMRKNT